MYRIDWDKYLYPERLRKEEQTVIVGSDLRGHFEFHASKDCRRETRC